MKKKTPIKKKIESKKHKPFDLSITKPEQGIEIIDALQSLEQDRGWLLLKQVFEGNIAVLEGAILKKLDPEDGKSVLSEADCDRLRDKLAYLEELLGKPQEIIKRFSTKPPEAPEYDPYEQSKRVVSNG